MRQANSQDADHYEGKSEEVSDQGHSQIPSSKGKASTVSSFKETHRQYQESLKGYQGRPSLREGMRSLNPASLSNVGYSVRSRKLETLRGGTGTIGGSGWYSPATQNIENEMTWAQQQRNLMGWREEQEGQKPEKGDLTSSQSKVSKQSNSGKPQNSQRSTQERKLGQSSQAPKQGSQASKNIGAEEPTGAKGAQGSKERPSPSHQNKSTTQKHPTFQLSNASQKPTSAQKPVGSLRKPVSNAQKPTSESGKP